MAFFLWKKRNSEHNIFENKERKKKHGCLFVVGRIYFFPFLCGVHNFVVFVFFFLFFIIIILFLKTVQVGSHGSHRLSTSGRRRQVFNTSSGIFNFVFQLFVLVDITSSSTHNEMANKRWNAQQS